MPKFKKKPVEIEAVRFTGENWDEMIEFCGTRRAGYIRTDIQTFTKIGSNLLREDDDQAAELWVEANKSWLPIVVGEWVIKDDLGYYPCKDEQFQKVYGSSDGAEEYHDENTLFKVRDALKHTPLDDGHMSDTEITDAINMLQNAGILFRERK